MDSTTLLFEFLLVSLIQLFIKRFYNFFTETKDKLAEETSNYQSVYNNVYSILLNLILKYQCIDAKAIKFYSRLLDHNLVVKFRLENINELSLSRLNCLIDVIYLLSVHDYIMIKANRKSREFLLVKINLDKNLLNLIIVIKKASNFLSQSTYSKIIQIIWLSRVVHRQSNNIFEQLKNLINTDSNFIKIFSKLNI